MVSFMYLPCNSNCYICGSPLEEFEGTRDHFIPKHSGGSDSIENLRPACHSCNALKNSYKPSVLMFITVAFVSYTKCISIRPGGFVLKAKSYELNKNLDTSKIQLLNELSAIKVYLHLSSYLGNLKIDYALSGESSKLPVVLIRTAVRDIVERLQANLEYYVEITKGGWPLDYWDGLLTPKCFNNGGEKMVSIKSPESFSDLEALYNEPKSDFEELLSENNTIEGSKTHNLVCSLCGSVSDISIPNAKSDVEIICPECLKVLNEFEVIPPIVKHLLRSRRDRVDKIATTVSDISNQLRKCLE